MPKKKTASWVPHAKNLGQMVPMNRAARREFKKKYGYELAPYIRPQKGPWLK